MDVMKKSLAKFVVSGVIFIFAGTLLYAYWGYKDNWFINYVPMLLMLYGWIAILFIVIAFHPGSVQKTTGKKTTLRWMANKLYYLAYAGWVYLLAQNVFALNRLKTQRIDYVLTTQPAADVTATVRYIEERWDKSGPHPFAIIAYPTASGEVEQSINDSRRIYAQGQTLHIKYSVAHPDMFALQGVSVDPYELP